MRDRITESVAFRKWPWLALTLVVGVCALLALNALHEREATARAAAPKAEQLAVQLTDMMDVARVVRDALPADDRSAVPAIVGARRDMLATRRLRELDAIVDDPSVTAGLHRRLDALRAAQGRRRAADADHARGSAPAGPGAAAPGTRRPAPQRDHRAGADGLPELPPLGPGTAPGDTAGPGNAQRLAVEALAHEAVAVARAQRDRAEATSRQTIFGAAAVLLAALLLIALLAMRGQRLLRDAHRDHADHLRRLADEDALTGLGNRRRLNERLTALTPDAEVTGPVQVFLCDLDGFKAYNDTHGHEAGDALLAEVGRHLAGAAGDRGEAFRLGGDEFCIVGLPGADLAATVDEAAATCAADGVSGTVGMAVWPAEAADGSATLRLADQRMYAGKRERPGRAAA